MPHEMRIGITKTLDDDAFARAGQISGYAAQVAAMKEAFGADAVTVEFVETKARTPRKPRERKPAPPAMAPT